MCKLDFVAASGKFRLRIFLFSGNRLSFEIYFRLFGSPTSRCGTCGRLFDYVTKVLLKN